MPVLAQKLMPFVVLESKSMKMTSLFHNLGGSHVPNIKVGLTPCMEEFKQFYFEM